MNAALHELWLILSGAMSGWHQAKLLVEHAVTISHDTLHLIVGVMIWLLLAMVMRRPITSWYPWLWLLAIILWNEMVDLWTETWPDPGQQYGEGLKDVALTIFVPTLMLVAARMRPDLFRQGIGRRRGRPKAR
ncbi:MAG: hypothetical protein ABIW33_09295 [Sphingomicrobium sp.]